MRDLREVFSALESSAFRRNFSLGPKELDYLTRKGMATIVEHARDFIERRLAGPRCDGHYPMAGKPGEAVQLIRKLALFLAALALLPASAAAQLRPLEPVQWRLFEGCKTVATQIGGARLFDQRASLAGTTGDLWEAGNFAVAWRTGRVVLEAAGTVQRIFHETGTFDTPYPDVEASDEGRRHDSGDYRVSTTVRLTPSRFPFDGVVRFGTRLPTTDNTTGLDRDALDFFATVGALFNSGPFALAGETGVGIHTTREQQFEQDDLLLYALRGEYRMSLVTPSFAVLGQKHGTTHSSIRGVENLGEMRAGIRVGRSAWIRVEYVRGYETFSPSSGVIVTAGLIR